MTLLFDKHYGIVFRAYNDAVAYRFYSKGDDEYVIKNEEVKSGREILLKAVQ